MIKLDKDERYFNGQKVLYKPIKVYEPIPIIVRKDNGSDRVLIEIGKGKQIVYRGNLETHSKNFI